MFMVYLANHLKAAHLHLTYNDMYGTDMYLQYDFKCAEKYYFAQIDQIIGLFYFDLNDELCDYEYNPNKSGHVLYGFHFLIKILNFKGFNKVLTLFIVTSQCNCSNWSQGGSRTLLHG